MNPVQNAADPHSQIRTTTQPCQLHSKHIPESHVNHRHHIWPKADGGPDTGDNIIVACPTGHSNVHDLLSFYRMHMGNVPYAVTRRYSFKEREIAKLGFDRLTRRSL